MKKSITLIMALAMILGMSQCKKRIETVTPNIVTDEGVFVSITIDRGDKHVVYPDGTVEFETGDVLYVGNDSKYCGTLTYSGNDQFSGTITPTSTDDYLHFYFVGGFAPKTAPEAGTTTSLTVNISDQSSNLPVLSYGQSTEKYTSGVSSYTSFLLNKCGLVKFNLTNTDIPAATKVAILGMNNEATIHFDGEPFTYSKEGNGQVILNAIDDQNRWAILPVQAAVTDAVAKVYGYANSTTFGVPAVTANMYYTTGVSIPEMELMLDNPLTFEAKQAGSQVKLTYATTLTNTIRMQSNTNGTSWEDYTSETVITLNNIGDKVMFRALDVNTTLTTANSSGRYSYFTISGNVYVYGNVMSLLYSEFSDKTEFPTSSTFTFYRLFDKGYSYITNHPNKPIILPATTLVASCYNYMFKGCTNLTTAPELPATTLADYCYYDMFNGCTNLTTAPELPATTLASYCYNSMFYGCSGLTTAPELPATTLANSCYDHMFSGCTSLESAPELPVTTLASDCYRSMFSNCTNLTTAPELPATTLAGYCYQYMFSGCTSLTAAPELPATTLASACYDWMFDGCTSLTAAPELPATTLASSCYSDMFYGCTSLESAPELPATTLADYCYYGMFNGCINLATAHELPATTLAEGCYGDMFNGCTRLTAAPALPATTLAGYCYMNMFNGCTMLTTAPELPATELVSNCYEGMFQDCTNLSAVTCLATNPNTTDCQDWLIGVANTGTFTKAAGVEWEENESGIPIGWTVVDR